MKLTKHNYLKQLEKHRTTKLWLLWLLVSGKISYSYWKNYKIGEYQFWLYAGDTNKISIENEEFLDETNGIKLIAQNVWLTYDNYIIENISPSNNYFKKDLITLTDYNLRRKKQQTATHCTPVVIQLQEC